MRLVLHRSLAAAEPADAAMPGYRRRQATTELNPNWVIRRQEPSERLAWLRRNDFEVGLLRAHLGQGRRHREAAEAGLENGQSSGLHDRGREMSEHKILEEDLGIDVYFCDPHSPWQKGTCENMNGLIRQYLPKGIDLNQADQHYLNQVAMSLNTRPRKALDWLTPLEKFAQLVDYHKAFETVAPHV